MPIKLTQEDAATTTVDADLLWIVTNVATTATTQKITVADFKSSIAGITLDLGDDGGDDTLDLGEIATSGDTNNIFTEPSADKLLIDCAQNWPASDDVDIIGQTLESTVDGAADYILMYDATATANRRVLINNLPSTTNTALDLGDTGSNESAALNEIAITGDTNSIFTEPSDDKLLIACANNWPTADDVDINGKTADATPDGAADYVMTYDANAAVNKKVLLNNLPGATGPAITLDLGDDGGNDSVALTEIATTGDTNSIFTEPSADKLLIDCTKNWPKAAALSRSINQTGHGFAVGNAIRVITGSNYGKTDANTEAGVTGYVGIVTAVADPDNFTVAGVGSYVTTMSGLTIGTTYYLSLTPGALTATKPATGNLIVAFVARTATAGWVVNQALTDINTLNSLASPVTTTDFVMVHQASSGKRKKTLISNLGIGGGGGGSGLTSTGTKVANYTATSGERVLVNTASAAGDFTVTLPQYPAVDDEVEVVMAGDHATRAVDIALNGNNADGSTVVTIWRLVREGDRVLFTMIGGDTGWAVRDGIASNRVIIFKNIAQSIPDVTVTKVTLDSTLDVDYGGIGDITGDNRVEIRRSGRYQVVASAEFAGMTDGKTCKLHIYVGNSQVATDTRTVSLASGSTNVVITLSVEIAVIVGDFIDLRMEHDLGSPINTATTIGERPQLSVREIRKS